MIPIDWNYFETVETLNQPIDLSNAKEGIIDGFVIDKLVPNTPAHSAIYMQKNREEDLPWRSRALKRWFNYLFIHLQFEALNPKNEKLRSDMITMYDLLDESDKLKPLIPFFKKPVKQR